MIQANPFCEVFEKISAKKISKKFRTGESKIIQRTIMKMKFSKGITVF